MNLVLKACHLCMSTELPTGGAQFKHKLAKLIEVFKKMRVICMDLPEDEYCYFKGFVKKE